MGVYYRLKTERTEESEWEKRDTWQIQICRRVSKVDFEKANPLHTCITHLKIQIYCDENICLRKLGFRFCLFISREHFIWMDIFEKVGKMC